MPREAFIVSPTWKMRRLQVLAPPSTRLPLLPLPFQSPLVLSVLVVNVPDVLNLGVQELDGEIDDLPGLEPNPSQSPTLNEASDQEVFPDAAEEAPDGLYFEMERMGIWHNPEDSDIALMIAAGIVRSGVRSDGEERTAAPSLVPIENEIPIPVPAPRYEWLGGFEVETVSETFVEDLGSLMDNGSSSD